ncbi:MAG: hypothetical protein VZR95_04000 [Alphaproteobacteria bacterium]
METRLKLLALEIRTHGKTLAVKFESFEDGYNVTHYAIEYDGGYYLLMYRDIRIKAIYKCDNPESMTTILDSWRGGEI